MSLSVSRFIWANSTLFSERIGASLSLNPISKAGFLKNKESAWNIMHGKSCRNLKYLGMLKNLQTTTFVRYSNINPSPADGPSGSPSGSLRNWIVGLVLTFIIPFFTHKWGSLLLLKSKVDQKIEKTEHIVKTIENVAEKVDQVIDSITDDLPKDSKLKKTLEYVDEIAEGVAKSAHVADDIINKVEEAEDKLESLIHEKNLNMDEIPQNDKDTGDQQITNQLKSDNNINKTKEN